MEPSERLAVEVSALPLPSDGPSTELLKKLRRIVIFGFRIPAQDAEDVLQESLLHFVRERQHRPIVTDGLLVVITRRRCLDYWRQASERRSEVAFEDVDSLDDKGALARRLYSSACVAQAWPGISAGCRQILADRFWRLDSATALAVELGRRPNTVRRFISRCLKRLRARLKERP